jgi:hypothetical protein
MDRGQFYHYETYGRNASDAKKKRNSSLYSVLGEAFREAEFSSHIKKIDTDNHPPEIIFTDMEFEKGLENDAKLEAQKVHLKKLAESYAKTKRLKMKDGCILAGVVSYPPGTAQEKLSDQRTRLVLPFLKKKWGTSLRCVIGHSDEYFWDNEEKKREPHFQDHFYVILDAESEIRLPSLHAGKVAKNKAIAGEIFLKEDENQWVDSQGKFVMEAMPLNKKENKQKNGNETKSEKNRENSKHSDRAYRDAMSKEQDEFFSSVGKSAGWARSTVNGVRYSRDQVKAWKQNQRDMEEQQKTVKKEIEQKKLAAVEDRKQIINEGKTKAARIKKTAFNISNTIINAAEKQKNAILTEADKDQESILSAIKSDLTKIEMPNPKLLESAKSYLERFSGWIKGLIHNITTKEKELKEKEVELNKKIKDVDHQLYVLSGGYGEKNKLILTIGLLQGKLNTLQNPVIKSSKKENGQKQPPYQRN